MSKFDLIVNSVFFLSMAGLLVSVSIRKQLLTFPGINPSVVMDHDVMIAGWSTNAFVSLMIWVIENMTTVSKHTVLMMAQKAVHESAVYLSVCALIIIMVSATYLIRHIRHVRVVVHGTAPPYDRCV